jgi:hypothetical protein
MRDFFLGKLHSKVSFAALPEPFQPELCGFFVDGCVFAVGCQGFFCVEDVGVFYFFCFVVEKI